MVASSTALKAGASATVTATLKDKYANPVSGDSVTLTGSTGSKATVTTSPAVTNGSGVAVFKVTDTTAQKATFTAKDTTASVTLTQTPSVTWSAAALDPATSSVGAAPTSVQANGSATSTISVTERDKYSNPISGHTVKLTQSAGGHSRVSGSPATTDATGVATFSVADHTAETLTYTAEDTTTSVTVGTATVAFTTPTPKTQVSSVTVTPGAPYANFGAGVKTNYSIAFKTSALGSLWTGSTVSVVFPSGTTLPKTAGAYSLTGASVKSVAGTGTGSKPLVLTLGATTTVGNSASETLAITGVTDPTAMSSTDTVALSTSSDTLAATSADYAVIHGAPDPTVSSVVASTGSTTADRGHSDGHREGQVRQRRLGRHSDPHRLHRLQGHRHNQPDHDRRHRGGGLQGHRHHRPEGHLHRHRHH